MAGNKGRVIYALHLTAYLSKYGAWGTKEYVTQPLADAPKYQAILNFMQVLQPGGNIAAVILMWITMIFEALTMTI